MNGKRYDGEFPSSPEDAGRVGIDLPQQRIDARAGSNLLVSRPALVAVAAVQ
jgi:hypothetical protein